MKLQIDIPHRYACMRAHTATHLLHAELGKIFPQTKQAGSYVGPDELRFDFFAQRSLTSEELHHITQVINTIIFQNANVSIEEMSYDQAIQTGAKAFFEDTYPEIVRVVKIEHTACHPEEFACHPELVSGSQNKIDTELNAAGHNGMLSIELCGGTHVAETSQIGSFFITEQTAVAAGVKRIVALTGPKVAAHAQSLQSDLESVATKISVPVKQLDTKIEKILAEAADLQKKFDLLSRAAVHTLEPMIGKLGEYSCDTIRDYSHIQANILSFSQIVDHLKSLNHLSSRLLYTPEGQYALFHPQAKIITKALGLKGGGSDTFVQGRDEKIVGLLSY